MKAASELRATYRLQLGGGLDFARVRELVPYLRDLGVSHLYLSPSMQARSGSTHGYDVVDPTRVSDALGGEQGLRALAACGLPIVLDIVPNHMGVSDENRWWSDPQLRAQFFDIDRATGRHRRFFDVDDLAALRQEDPHVFEVTHAKALQLVRDGVVFGLRVDHPDGLADPAAYLRRLRDGGAARVWVEKILAAAPPAERLRDWPVRGTVGYEFLNDVAALFVDPAGEAALDELWGRVSGDSRSFAEIALQAQLEQTAGPFAPDVERLRALAPRFATEDLARGLAGLPIYRTYVEPSSGRVEEPDRAAVVAAAMKPDLADALLLAARDGIPDELVTRFQQTSPAIAGKGIEDTAFYRHLRLLALNEVGGDPARFSLAVDDFHAANVERARRFPQGLLVTQTHDTKRSGDARARIGALAGMAGEWARRVARWHELVEPLRHAASGPDDVEQYLIFQTLVSVWPISGERLAQFLRKALREAKRNTDWASPNEPWERDTIDFGLALLHHEPFMADVRDFLSALGPAGGRSALGQLLLKLTCPGVPDIFQGDELWRLSLVDPDNRRPVDWAARREALARVRAGGPPQRDDLKMWLIVRALALRSRLPGAFAGDYTPVPAGPDVCAFLRGDAEVLVAVALRADIERARGAVLELPDEAAGEWREILSDTSVTLGTLGELSALGVGVEGMWLAERVR